jgi:hypothetical protein
MMNNIQNYDSYVNITIVINLCVYFISRMKTAQIPINFNKNLQCDNIA